MLLLIGDERKHNGLNRKEFSEKIDTAPAVISQITSTTLKTKKSMGDILARKIERKIGLPHGWMDAIHTPTDDDMSSAESELTA